MQTATQLQALKGQTVKVFGEIDSAKTMPGYGYTEQITGEIHSADNKFIHVLVPYSADGKRHTVRMRRRFCKVSLA